MNALFNASLWIAAIGCGLMAGIYFAFSTFMMGSLAAIPKPAGIAAMQSINDVIVQSPFLPLFFGTSLVSLGLAGWSVSRWGEAGSSALLLGSAIYLIGMLLCTIAFNVPLNNALAAVAPDSAEAASLWPIYLRDWTRWNHLRTLASALASGLFTLALVSRA